MSDKNSHESVPVSFGADQLAAVAAARQRAAGAETLCLNHWLKALLEQPSAFKAAAPGIDSAALATNVNEQLGRGENGQPLSSEEVFEKARKRAAELGHAVVTAEDVSVAVFANVDESARAALQKAVPAAEPVAAAAPGTTPAEPSPSYGGRAAQPTPTLDQFGRDLTRAAVAGDLPKLVGREQELQMIEEIICRRTKRNPALVGPAGIGKTAIVEGLAQRIVAGDVPDVLKGTRIVALQPSSLTAGAGIVGELEKRMQAVIAEASQDGIILFIDELHSMVGSGGRMGVNDVGELIKPALARGDLAVIGATTDDEYRQSIEPDKALERRFNRVRVQEPSLELTRQVLVSHRDSLAELRSVTIADAILDWLLDFADHFLRNRSFPDKAVDLLEQCVAHAVVRSKKEVSLEDAKVIAELMVGMPVDLSTRLEQLQQRLVEEGLLFPEEAERLADRLNVAMQGLELRPQRPNAVLLLIGEAAGVADSVATAVAEELLGGPDRVIELDFGQLTDSEDLNTLLGPPPGYIGFEGRRPLHALVQMPWAALICRNVHGSHREINGVLAQALADGHITERSGKRIYLSDAVVIMTAQIGSGAHKPIGFITPDEEPKPAIDNGIRAAAARELGAGLLNQVDIICDCVPEEGSGARNWIDRLLGDLLDRYRQRGLQVDWKPEVTDWVLEERERCGDRFTLVRVVEDAVGAVLVPLLPAPGSQAQPATLAIRDGKLEAGAKPAKGEKAKGGKAKGAKKT